MVKLIILGQPITKKNSMRVYGRRVLQSKAYCEYEEESLWKIKQQRPEKMGNKWVNLEARYYLKNRRRPDLIGLLQATSDILEKSEVIDNDKYIVSYDGSRIVEFSDKNPRVEITLTEDLTK